MKVIYETVGDAIRKAIRTADETNRRINHIELTWGEAGEIIEECRKYLSPYVNDLPAVKTTTKPGDVIGYYRGVKLVIAP